MTKSGVFYELIPDRTSILGHGGAIIVTEQRLEWCDTSSAQDSLERCDVQVVVCEL